MGKKIFVSYKYADDQVEHLGCDDSTTTVRDYVTDFENRIDSSNHIYKGEHDEEDLSQLEDDTIWEKLKVILRQEKDLPNENELYLD